MTEKRKVGRPKKNGKYVNCYCDANIVDKLESYSESEGISKTVVIEHALAMYFDSLKSKKSLQEV